MMKNIQVTRFLANGVFLKKPEGPGQNYSVETSEYGNGKRGLLLLLSLILVCASIIMTGNSTLPHQSTSR